MEKIIESTDYPLVTIKLKIDDFELKKEAYADTGATTYGAYVPENYFEFNKVKQKFFSVPVTTGDGTTHFWKAYIGKIKIGNKEFDESSIVVGTQKLILGRGILDQLISIFDGPNQKITLNEH